MPVKTLLPELIFAIKRIGKQVHAGIAHGAMMDVRGIADNDQLSGVPDRQHLEHHCILQAEDGGVCANAKRQRHHSHGSKGGILAQHAQRVLKVL